jgi:hypothetical protein
MTPSHRRHCVDRQPWAHAVNAVIAMALALMASGCRGKGDIGAIGLSPEERAATAVRDSYLSPDLVASAAWVWVGPDSIIFVMVDVESAIPGIVQGRADLWAVTEGQPSALGRSAVMPSMASLGGFAFEDLTGDGLPDFFGYVADSADTEYPIFLPGAHGALVEEVEIAGSGYRFSLDEANPPAVLRAPGGLACALQLWAEEPSADSLPAGWRYLALGRGGQLLRPSVHPPDCGGPPSESHAPSGT